MSLKKLLALQAKKQETESPKAGPISSPLESAKVEAESPVVEATTAPSEVSVKPKGLGLNLASASRAVAAAKPAPAKPTVIETDSFSLEDLAGLSTDVVAVPASQTPSGFEYPDEIEATAPDRDLPPDLAPELVSFAESLDGIYSVLHDPEMFGQSVRFIMMELQENKEYGKLLSDPDIHTMIHGMRRTMGLAKVRKQEKSRKATTNKNARKASGVSDSAMALLDGLLGGSDD